MNTRVLLVTRDRDVIGRMTESSSADSLVIVYLDHFSQVNLRLDTQAAVQVLAVDLSALKKQEFEALRLLMLASPDVPVLILGNEYDPVVQADLLAQGVQEVLLKCDLNRCVLRRAMQSAIARKAREMTVFDDNERAHATLASIGDAVLSTDNNGVVTFMNSIAEKLTGWACSQALGQHVSDVFQVLDGVTRVPITPQIEIAVGTGSTIILPPNCLVTLRSAPVTCDERRPG